MSDDTWNGLDFDVPSKGVVACDGSGHGAVIWARGAHIRFEIEESGFSDLGDLGLDDAPEGISVWEGFYVWSRGRCLDEGSVPQGVFRRPTEDEWAAIREHRCPWGPDPDMIDPEAGEEGER